MKKLMIIALALIFMVPALAVYAGEVEIGGSYRVTWTKFDPGFAGADTGMDDVDRFQQRIRIPVTWKANDNVSFFLRSDWSENQGFGANITGDIDIDYAYATISHDLYRLRSGMQIAAFGNYIMYDADLYGFTLNIMPAEGITIGFDYGKQSEGLSNATDNSIGATNDTDLYAIHVNYKSDAFSVGAIIAQQDNSNRTAALPDRDVVTGYGVVVKVPINEMLSINAEMNFFDGDNGGQGAGQIDYTGTQFLFDLGVNLSETLALGFTAVYAQGTDDADEVQVTTVNNTAGDFGNPMDWGGALGYDEAWTTGTASVGSVFEPALNSGVIGLAFRVTAKVAEPVTLYARAGWLSTDEEDNGTAIAGAAGGPDLEDVLFVNVSVDYAWQPNVTLSLGGLWQSADFGTAGTYDDEKTALVARMGINF